MMLGCCCCIARRRRRRQKPIMEAFRYVLLLLLECQTEYRRNKASMRAIGQSVEYIGGLAAQYLYLKKRYSLVVEFGTSVWHTAFNKVS